MYYSNPPKDPDKEVMNYYFFWEATLPLFSFGGVALGQYITLCLILSCTYFKKLENMGVVVIGIATLLSFLGCRAISPLYLVTSFEPFVHDLPAQHFSDFSAGNL